MQLRDEVDVHVENTDKQSHLTHRDKIQLEKGRWNGWVPWFARLHDAGYRHKHLAADGMRPLDVASVGYQDDPDVPG